MDTTCSRPSASDLETVSPQRTKKGQEDVITGPACLKPPGFLTLIQCSGHVHGQQSHPGFFNWIRASFCQTQEPGPRPAVQTPS